VTGGRLALLAVWPDFAAATDRSNRQVSRVYLSKQMPQDARPLLKRPAAELVETPCAAAMVHWICTRPVCRCSKTLCCLCCAGADASGVVRPAVGGSAAGHLRGAALPRRSHTRPVTRLVGGRRQALVSLFCRQAFCILLNDASMAGVQCCYEDFEEDATFQGNRPQSCAQAS